MKEIRVAFGMEPARVRVQVPDDAGCEEVARIVLADPRVLKKTQGRRFRVVTTTASGVTRFCVWFEDVQP